MMVNPAQIQLAPPSAFDIFADDVHRTISQKEAGNVEANAIDELWRGASGEPRSRLQHELQASRQRHEDLTDLVCEIKSSVMFNNTRTTSATSVNSGNSLNHVSQRNGAGNSNGPNSPGGGGAGSGSNSTSGSNQANGPANNGHGMPGHESENYGIKDVWASNMEEEFKVIREIVADYPYVAMDTEFPGVVARPIGEFRSTCEYQYHLLKVNVDLLKIIQLGLTFMNKNGHPRPGVSTWQFNFRFNLNDDMYAHDSIELLQNSGIQFKRHEEEGIDVFEFAELLLTSGVVLNDDVKYLSFHSGYDFGYLLKILTCMDLPAEEADFFDLLRIYFPFIYDVKYLMKSCKDLKGGLQEVGSRRESDCPPP